MKAFSAALLAGALLFSLRERVDADGDLLARMSALNPNLHSYTATMHAHVALTTFPFIQTDLVGTYYHKDPDFNKLEITDGLPGIAKQFGKLYPHIVPPALWRRTFVVKRDGDDGKQTTFTLVPRVNGQVERIDTVVDDTAATITSTRWIYQNGGSATMTNSYSTVDGNLVITAQTGSVDEPGYKGNVTSTLDTYVINPSIPDDTFKEQ